MGWNEFSEVASAAGVPATFGLFVLFVLYKNGFLKVIMRDNSLPLINEMRKDVDMIDAEMASLRDKIHVIETLAARLDERSKKGN